VFLTVDFDAEELACQAKIGDFVLFQVPGLNFDCGFRRVYSLQHQDVIDE
jgi:hypothetical protein